MTVLKYVLNSLVGGAVFTYKAVDFIEECLIQVGGAVDCTEDRFIQVVVCDHSSGILWCTVLKSVYTDWWGVQS